MLKKAKEILLISIVTFISFFFLSACSNKSASKQQMTRPKELQSWQMSNMNYIQLHKLSTGKSQKIALIDSGVTQNEKTVYSASLIGGSEFDENGHGTMMYSLIKGIPNELQGIAPDVSIISLKIMGAESSVTPEIIKQEIYYGHVFNSFEELEQAITKWIHYYNTKRIKKKLNWMSPIQYRLTYSK